MASRAAVDLLDRRTDAAADGYPRLVTTTRGDTTAGSTATPRGIGAAGNAVRRVWPWVSVLLAAVVWWPVGFWGAADWPGLPLRALEGDVVLLGAVAAAASVSLLLRQPWPRFLVVLVLSGLGWLASAPAGDQYPDEREVLVLLLAVGAFAGILLGARGHKGPLGAAGVLALVAGLSPATWPHGIPLAVALALPFAVATWQRVAPTLLSVLRVLLTWLVASLAARACSYGWDVLHPGLQAGSKRAEIRLVGDASWDFARTQWWTWTDLQLHGYAAWFWVALALAAVIAAARVLTTGVRRRPPAASPSHPGS